MLPQTVSYGGRTSVLPKSWASRLEWRWVNLRDCRLSCCYKENWWSHGGMTARRISSFGENVVKVVVGVSHHCTRRTNGKSLVLWSTIWVGQTKVSGERDSNTWRVSLENRFVCLAYMGAGSFRCPTVSLLEHVHWCHKQPSRAQTHAVAAVESSS